MKIYNAADMKEYITKNTTRVFFSPTGRKYISCLTEEGKYIYCFNDKTFDHIDDWVFADVTYDIYRVVNIYQASIAILEDSTRLFDIIIYNKTNQIYIPIVVKEEIVYIKVKKDEPLFFYFCDTIEEEGSRSRISDIRLVLKDA